MRAQFTEHDRKLWNEMGELCDRFLKRELGLKSLVASLQGLLDAVEVCEKALRERWYSLWLPLEIRNATGEVDWSPDAAREVQALRTYINDCLNPVSRPDV